MKLFSFFNNAGFISFINLIIVLIIVFFLYKIILCIGNLISRLLKVEISITITILGLPLILFSDDLKNIFNSLYEFITYPFLSKIKINNILSDAINEVYAGKMTFDLGNITISFLKIFFLWLIISWLINITYLYIRDQIRNNPNTDIFDLYMTKAFLLTSFFLLSLFLVISSIVAVPEFQSIQVSIDSEKLEREFNAELEQRLDLIKVSDLKITQQSQDSLNTFKDSTKNGQNFKNENYSEESQIVPIIEYNALLERFQIFLENQRRTLSYLYIQEVYGGLSEKNRNAYRVQLINNSLNQLYLIIQRFKSIRSRFLTAPQSVIYQKKLYSLDTAAINSDFKVIKKLIVMRPSPPPNPSISLGIFGFMSRWLLMTRSISLALIVGMFGFGLLGAIVSSFARERIDEPDPDKKSTKQIIARLDIRTILITGITAAIVIFLTVKGALLIFTTPENNSGVNPYMLFFICFAAALYNDVVWQWVLNRFNNILNSNQQAKNLINTSKIILDQKAIVGKPFSFAIPIETFPMTDDYRFSVNIDSDIPPGLTYSAITRTLSGVPTKVGNYIILVKATSDKNYSIATSFVLFVIDN